MKRARSLVERKTPLTVEREAASPEADGVGGGAALLGWRRLRTLGVVRVQQTEARSPGARARLGGLLCEHVPYAVEVVRGVRCGSVVEREVTWMPQGECRNPSNCRGARLRAAAGVSVSEAERRQPLAVGGGRPLSLNWAQFASVMKFAPASLKEAPIGSVPSLGA